MFCLLELEVSKCLGTFSTLDVNGVTKLQPEIIFVSDTKIGGNTTNI